MFSSLSNGRETNIEYYKQRSIIIQQPVLSRSAKRRICPNTRLYLFCVVHCYSESENVTGDKTCDILCTNIKNWITLSDVNATFENVSRFSCSTYSPASMSVNISFISRTKDAEKLSLGLFITFFIKSLFN